MKIFLANPRGFCAGVKRAIDIVKNSINIYGSPVYVYHQIVHNKYVVNYLKAKGAIFIEDIDQVPENKILIFSAHGVSQKIRKKALSKKLKILFDATCPLVSKVHKEVFQASKKGIEVIFIGHKYHPEVQGTIGQYNYDKGGQIHLVESLNDIDHLKIKNKENLCYFTQTTLSIDDCNLIIKKLNKKFPKIIGPKKNDICYATFNRQHSINELAKKTDIIIVIGSKNSSNSNRLLEIAKNKKKIAKLIDSEKEIKKEWFYNINNIGITAGASAPEILVKKVILHLLKLGANSVHELTGKKEKTTFSLPKELII